MFQYLNHNDDWPRVRRFGMEVDPDTGALTLRKLPGRPQRIAGVPGDPSDTPVAAGVTTGLDGSIYLSDPERNQVLRIEAKSGLIAPQRCVGSHEPGWEVGQLNRPQGLAFQCCRNRLLIADTGNNRIQIVDPIQERVVAVWGQTWPYEKPQPAGRFAGLDGPRQLACDRHDYVYVIDATPGDRNEVVKLTPDGELTETSFDCGRYDPIHVATGRSPASRGDASNDWVFVLSLTHPDDHSKAAELELVVFVFLPDGRRVADEPLQLLRVPRVETKPSRTPSILSTGLGEIYSDFIATRQQQAAKLRQYATDSPEPPPAFQPVTAFTIIETTAVVALASNPPRVWCFELGESLRAKDPRLVEPSWLPLYDGPAVALGVQHTAHQAEVEPQLLLFAGPGRDVFRLTHRGAYRTQGAFLAGPFTGKRNQVTQWHRLRFDGRMSEHGYTQWFTFSQQDLGDPSERKRMWEPPLRPRSDRLPNWYRLETHPDLFARLEFDPLEETTPKPETCEFAPLRAKAAASLTPPRTPARVWHAFPENQFDGLIPNDGGTVQHPADQLWIFGLVAGDGTTSPALSQARLENNADGWLADLPEAYQRQPSRREVTRSLVTLLQSRFDDVTEAIDRLPALFSATAVAAQYGLLAAELDWLRTALALPAVLRTSVLRHDQERIRQLFADGPYWMARRGTPEGLRRLIWLATGVDVMVEEPGWHDLPWLLGAPTLPDPADSRMRLWDDLAHHVVVRGYESDMPDHKVRQLIEQAVSDLAPAHATYSVQVIEPLARVGVQSRLGIDTVVGSESRATPWTLDEPPGPETPLNPTPPPSTVGAAHLSRNTPLM
ncbi:hypothetical protein [Zavarzinella formosa]|uniref:hypothetical protein n=1 Tax=Zavarzinella formosa TaxID=360055 RepID=UPI0002F5599A|nr:hypothetical protein [Zavarzinella formosa]